METFGDKNKLAQPQQWAAEGFTAGQPHMVFFFFEYKTVHCPYAKSASLPDNFFARITFGYGGHDFNRQVIGPHLKGKAGIFSHAVAGNDAAAHDVKYARSSGGHK